MGALVDIKGFFLEMLEIQIFICNLPRLKLASVLFSYGACQIPVCLQAGLSLGLGCVKNPGPVNLVEEKVQSKEPGSNGQIVLSSRVSRGT